MRSKALKAKPLSYLVLMWTQHGEDLEMVRMTAIEIKERVISGKLHPSSFAVIDGDVIKSFDNSSVTHF